MAWKKQQIEDMELKIKVHKNRYEKKYNEWVGKYFNDKQLFCNIYEILIEEMEKMKKVNSDYIGVAFNRLVAEDQETMDRIMKRFQEMEVVN